jgi:O-antigen ligase
MPAIAVALLAVAVGVATALAPPRWAFAVLVGVLLLVPAPLVLPYQGSSFVTMPAVAMAGLLVGLLWRGVTGRLPAGTLSWTPVHAPFVVFLVVCVVAGVAIASPIVSDVDASHVFVLYAEQFVIFILALSYLRMMCDTRFALSTIATLLLLVAVIGVIEHYTGSAYTRALFYKHVAANNAGGSQPLSLRSGHVRVRGAAQFSVEYAWVGAALLPCLLVVVSRWRRWWRAAALALVGFTVLALYFSYTRSMVPAALIAIVLTVAVARRRWLWAAVIAVVAVVAVVLVANPQLAHPYSLSTEAGSITSRTSRLVTVLGLIAPHPWHGLGLASLSALGFNSTDDSFLMIYAQLGILGLITLGGLFLATLVAIGHGLRAAAHVDRMAAMAALCGVGLIVAAGFAMDQMAAQQSTFVLWMLAALGVSVAERVAAARPEWQLANLAPWRTLGLAAEGAIAGALVFAFAPLHSAGEVYFQTMPTYFAATSPVSISATADTLSDTACSLFAAEHARQRQTGASLQCSTIATTGAGTLRVQAASDHAVLADELQVLYAVANRDGFHSLRVSAEGPITHNRDTVTETAPLWVPASGLELGLFLPVGPALRRRRRAPA